jgi:hypothetical protein
MDVVTDSTLNQLSIGIAHFFHYSYVYDFIWVQDLASLCKNILLVVESGYITKERGSQKFLMPTSTCNSKNLMGRNSGLWTLQHFRKITLYYHLLQEVWRVQVMIWFLKTTFYYHLHVIILFHSLEETLM